LRLQELCVCKSFASAGSLHLQECCRCKSVAFARACILGNLLAIVQNNPVIFLSADRNSYMWCSRMSVFRMLIPESSWKNYGASPGTNFICSARPLSLESPYPEEGTVVQTLPPPLGPVIGADLSLILRNRGCSHGSATPRLQQRRVPITQISVPSARIHFPGCLRPWLLLLREMPQPIGDSHTGDHRSLRIDHCRNDIHQCR
jgi:hypothetical protein